QRIIVEGIIPVDDGKHGISESCRRPVFEVPLATEARMFGRIVCPHWHARRCFREAGDTQLVAEDGGKSKTPGHARSPTVRLEFFFHEGNEPSRKSDGVTLDEPQQ